MGGVACYLVLACGLGHNPDHLQQTDTNADDSPPYLKKSQWAAC